MRKGSCGLDLAKKKQNIKISLCLLDQEQPLIFFRHSFSVVKTFSGTGSLERETPSIPAGQRPLLKALLLRKNERERGTFPRKDLRPNHGLHPSRVAMAPTLVAVTKPQPIQ